MQNINQFKIDTGCNKYDIVNILSMSNHKLNKIKSVESNKSLSENVVENVVDNLDILSVTDIMDKITLIE